MKQRWDRRFRLSARYFKVCRLASAIGFRPARNPVGYADQNSIYCQPPLIVFPKFHGPNTEGGSEVAFSHSFANSADPKVSTKCRAVANFSEVV
jgi:hypothetical protein